MGCLLGLLAAQPEATKRTYWARRCAVALNAIELVAAAQGSLSLGRPGCVGGGGTGSSGETCNWVPAALKSVFLLSDPEFGPGEVKPSTPLSPAHPSCLFAMLRPSCLPPALSTVVPQFLSLSQPYACTNPSFVQLPSPPGERRHGSCLPDTSRPSPHPAAVGPGGAQRAGAEVCGAAPGGSGGAGIGRELASGHEAAAAGLAL